MSAAPQRSVVRVVFKVLGYVLVAASALVQLAIAAGFHHCQHGDCGSEGSTLIGAMLLGIFVVAPGALVALVFFALALYRRRLAEAVINAVVALSPIALLAWGYELSNPPRYTPYLAPMAPSQVAPAPPGARAVPNAQPPAR